MKLYRKQEDDYKKNIVRHLSVIIAMLLTFTIVILNYNGNTDKKGKDLVHGKNNAVYDGAIAIKSEHNKENNLQNNGIDDKEVQENTDSKLSNETYNDGTKTDLNSGTNKEKEITNNNKSSTNAETNTSANTKTNTINYQTDVYDKAVLAQVEERMKSMTIKEKICQMFIVSPEELTNYFNVTAAGANTKRAIERYHVGGVIYFASNIKSESQIKKLLNNTNTYATANNGIPMFLSVDEEGGQVTRIASNKNFKVERFDNMTYVTSGKEAYTIGSTIGTYLKNLGFNMDFAPVADVLTNKKNQVVKERSFGSNPKKVADYAYEVTKGLNDQGIYTSYKYFPGYGSTASDSHEGFAVTNKSYKKMYKEDFLPFLDGIEKNVDMIMVGHISAPKVIKDMTPSSLSKVMVTDILRGKLGYQGVILTDAMNMGAISKNYTVEESTVKAIKAGCDIILMPTDFRRAYASVVKAVNDGEISKEQINDSVRRILLLKKRRLDF